MPLDPNIHPLLNNRQALVRKKFISSFAISKYIINQVGDDKNANQGLVDLIYNQILGTLLEKIF